MAGLYEVSLIGQPTFHMRIRIDGKELPAPDLSSPGVARYPPSERYAWRPGRHSLALVAGGRGEIAYILAISVELTGKPAPVGRLRRRPARAARSRTARCGCNRASGSPPAAAAAALLDRIDEGR